MEEEGEEDELYSQHAELSHFCEERSKVLGPCGGSVGQTRRFWRGAVRDARGRTRRCRSPTSSSTPLAAATCGRFLGRSQRGFGPRMISPPAVNTSRPASRPVQGRRSTALVRFKASIGCWIWLLLVGLGPFRYISSWNLPVSFGSHGTEEGWLRPSLSPQNAGWSLSAFQS